MTCHLHILVMSGGLATGVDLYTLISCVQFSETGIELDIMEPCYEEPSMYIKHSTLNSIRLSCMGNQWSWRRTKLFALADSRFSQQVGTNAPVNVNLVGHSGWSQAFWQRKLFLSKSPFYHELTLSESLSYEKMKNENSCSRHMYYFLKWSIFCEATRYGLSLQPLLPGYLVESPKPAIKHIIAIHRLVFILPWPSHCNLLFIMVWDDGWWLMLMGHRLELENALYILLLWCEDSIYKLDIQEFYNWPAFMNTRCTVLTS